VGGGGGSGGIGDGGYGGYGGGFFYGGGTVAVPEPTSWALGILAMGTVIYLRRRAVLATR